MMSWSGAALIDRDGKLLGIGSLIVREATDGDPKLPGNMFVPIDLLKPILDRSGQDRPSRRTCRGRGSASPPTRCRAGCSSRASRPRDRPIAPACKPGDIILGVANDSVTSQADFYKKVWSRGKAGDEIPLKVLQGADVRSINIRSIDRTEYFRPKTTY